ncbi:MAG: hypothetical protein JST28_19185 [Acidobacteria bacterium]|nr:hypothetical protein [Acidobacteriota bacterium]
MFTKTSLSECRFDQFLRSDFLPQLLVLKEMFPALAPFFPQVLQLRLVVDADRVQGELRWRLQRRRNPAARSALHEAIDAGVLVLFAPRYVIHEIEKHLGEIADETGATVADAKREWDLFQGCLCFYSPRSSPSLIETYADINDFSYLATWSELDSQGVYTKDRHLAAMGAPVVSVLIDTHLREYARASTVQLAVKVGSSFSMVIGWEFLKIVYKLLVQCLRGICRLPPAAQIGLGAVCVLSVTHPKSRAMLREGWNAVANSQPFLQFCDAIVNLGLLAEEASLLAQSRHDYLKAAVPVRERRPLLQHARAVCVEAGESLSLQELERRIRRGGYVSRSQTFRRYLRRVLASDASFVEVAAGHWTLRTPVYCA